MGIFDSLFNLNSNSGGSVDGGGGVDRNDKEQTRKHYEKEVEKLTKEERERGERPPDPPKDGKVW